MDVTIKLHNRDGDLVEATLPGKYEVCPRCGGKGSIVNPAVDGNGLSDADFAEDPDFEEAYFSGVFDISCPECLGKRVVAIPDVSACTYAQRRLLVSERQWQIEDAHYRCEVNRELWAFGAG